MSVIVLIKYFFTGDGAAAPPQGADPYPAPHHLTAITGTLQP